MRKTAQNPFTTPYGQGALAGYGQNGYDTSVDNLGLLPGIEPTQQESYDPGGPTSAWKLPMGIAAGGLLASLLLRKGGGRLQSAGKSLRNTTIPKPTGPLSQDQIQLLIRTGKRDPAQFATSLDDMISKLPRI
jgi:hypothetical protein